MTTAAVKVETREPEQRRDIPSRPRWMRRYAQALVVLDAATALSAGVLADFARFGSSGGTYASDGFEIPYAFAALLATPIWLAFFALAGAYDQNVIGTGADEHRRVFNAGVRFFTVLAITAYALELDLSRRFTAYAVIFALGLTHLERQVCRWYLHHERGRGRYSQDVLVVGSRQAVVNLVRHLRRAPYAGYRVLGVAVPNGPAVEVDGEPVPVLCDPANLYEAIENTQADAIAVADTECLPEGALQRLAWHLEGSGIDLIVAPAITDVAGPRVSVRPVAGLPLLHVEEPEFSGFRRVAKEIFDRSSAAAVLLLFSPALIAIALVIRLSSPGPIFFKQARVGRHGRLFGCWKLRSMYVDAEEQREELTGVNEHDGVLFKIRRDPRVTPVGRWLRRFSIDEFPQLFNVLKGDMSLIGPRPPLPSEVEAYPPHMRRRLLVKPGLTGLWQVSGRADLSWDETIRLDLYYVENWSPALDLMILWKTVAAVVRGRGAY